MRHFRSPGMSNGGGGAGDVAIEFVPRLFQGVRNRAGTHVADVTGQAVDHLPAHARCFHFHRRQADNASFPA